MLKIKDNVDLKELEKYGFKEKNIGYEKENLWILKENRIIRFPTNGDTIKMLIVRLSKENAIDDTLYDLIKADLVEKVEDNE